MSSLVKLGPLFHSLWRMYPVRLIMSGVLIANFRLRIINLKLDSDYLKPENGLSEVYEIND